jgi:acyl-CoA synthetase (AMP-forming)/AMP-acid ligase II
LHAEGLKDGDRIATVCDSQIEWVVMLWVAARLRCVLVPFSPKSLSRQAEITHMLDMVKPQALLPRDVDMAIKLANQAPDQLQRIRLEILSGKCVLDGWKAMDELLIGEIYELPEPNEDINATALIIFTSGTTSPLGKACPATARNVCKPALGHVAKQRLNPTHILV